MTPESIKTLYVFSHPKRNLTYKELYREARAEGWLTFPHHIYMMDSGAPRIGREPEQASPLVPEGASAVTICVLGEEPNEDQKETLKVFSSWILPVVFPNITTVKDTRSQREMSYETWKESL